MDVIELTGGNVVLNAVGEPGGEGSIVKVPSAALGADGILSPGESFTQEFRIGLAPLDPFDFFVDAYGVLISTASSSSSSSMSAGTLSAQQMIGGSTGVVEPFQICGEECTQ